MKKALILILVAGFTASCTSFYDVRRQFKRKPTVGVIWNLKPAGAGESEYVIGPGRRSGRLIEEDYKVLADDVVTAIKEYYGEADVFVVENRAEFDADFIVGIYARGKFVKWSGGDWKVVIESILTFKNMRMTEFIGEDEGYQVGEVKSEALYVPETESFTKRGMPGQALEELIRIMKPIQYLEPLREETRKNVGKIMKRAARI